MVDRSFDEDKSRALAKLEEVAKHQIDSKEDSKRMIEMLNNADDISRGRHEELISLNNQLLVSIKAMILSGSPSPLPAPLNLTYLNDEIALEAAEQTILSSLYYASIHDREDTITEAYGNTLRWIFQDPKPGQSWDSFVDFLTTDRSSYWITGKPGSGKSTLMKFINESTQTRDLLTQWTKDRELLEVSYYFYYNGSSYQKSEIGLVRSLLYSILNKKRNLIPITFYDRFQAALEGKRYDDPSLAEAKRALRSLVVNNPELCFFISIDGLDEFDTAVSLTHVQSLIDFTHFLEGCENVKILVSSRPLREFERGYENCASLKTHDLIMEDIRRYVHGKLRGHERMDDLLKEDPGCVRDLIQSITESSLGVFLWVRLVTESLIDGLNNYDSIAELKHRLEGLPSDLQDLYRTMLSRVNPRYKPQTARLLCFVHHMQKLDQSMTLLDLWFAENADDNMVCTTQVEPISKEQRQGRMREIEARLKSRCLGLIETVYPTEYDTITKAFGTAPAARFLHRSVYEFLNRPEVWDEVVEQYVGRVFSCALSLFRSIILLFKTWPPTTSHWYSILNAVRTAMTRARLAEKETKQAHASLVNEFDLVMGKLIPHLHRDAQFDRTVVGGPPNPQNHWSAWQLHLDTVFYPRRELRPMHRTRHLGSSLISAAAEYGLHHYIRSQITTVDKSVIEKEGFPLLGYSLIPIHGLPDVETVQLLIDLGSDPNEQYGGRTLWEWFLVSRSMNDMWQKPEYISIMEAMLLGGADPNMGVIWARYDQYSQAPVDVYTILLAMTEVQIRLKTSTVIRLLSALQVTDTCEAVERMINFLEARGAKKLAWKEDDLDNLTLNRATLDPKRSFLGSLRSYGRRIIAAGRR